MIQILYVLRALAYLNFKHTSCATLCAFVMRPHSSRWRLRVGKKLNYFVRVKCCLFGDPRLRQARRVGRSVGQTPLLVFKVSCRTDQTNISYREFEKHLTFDVGARSATSKYGQLTHWACFWVLRFAAFPSAVASFDARCFSCLGCPVPPSPRSSPSIGCLRRGSGEASAGFS